MAVCTWRLGRSPRGQGLWLWQPGIVQEVPQQHCDVCCGRRVCERAGTDWVNIGGSHRRRPHATTHALTPPARQRGGTPCLPMPSAPWAACTRTAPRTASASTSAPPSSRAALVPVARPDVQERRTSTRAIGAGGCDQGCICTQLPTWRGCRCVACVRREVARTLIDRRRLTAGQAVTGLSGFEWRQARSCRKAVLSRITFSVRPAQGQRGAPLGVAQFTNQPTQSAGPPPTPWAWIMTAPFFSNPTTQQEAHNHSQPAQLVLKPSLSRNPSRTRTSPSPLALAFNCFLHQPSSPLPPPPPAPRRQNMASPQALHPPYCSSTSACLRQGRRTAVPRPSSCTTSTLVRLATLPLAQRSPSSRSNAPAAVRVLAYKEGGGAGSVSSKKVAKQEEAVQDIMVKNPVLLRTDMPIK